MPKNLTIAIDGFSSTGKSTLARQMAKALDYIYVDSGAMYRAVTLFALQRKMIAGEKLDSEKLVRNLELIQIGFQEVEGKQHTVLNDKDVEKEIRDMEVSNWVSPVAAIPEVRKFLVAQQQAMEGKSGIVMDGRDIATVVFPNAELKIFVTASPEIRAERRFAELQANGMPAELDKVRENLLKRDHIDSTREDSPLRKADDAKVLDNSFLSMEDQLGVALSWAQELLNS